MGRAPISRAPFATISKVQPISPAFRPSSCVPGASTCSHGPHRLSLRLGPHRVRAATPEIVLEASEQDLRVLPQADLTAAPLPLKGPPPQVCINAAGAGEAPPLCVPEERIRSFLLGAGRCRDPGAAAAPLIMLLVLGRV